MRRLHHPHHQPLIQRIIERRIYLIMLRPNHLPRRLPKRPPQPLSHDRTSQNPAPLPILRPLSPPPYFSLITPRNAKSPRTTKNATCSGRFTVFNSVAVSSIVATRIGPS